MKKIILSAAVAAMAFSTSAVAADKGIDIDVSGQAALYYETHSSNMVNDKGQLDQANSTANAGVQLNLGSDLGNNFTFGSQITYLGALGLEKTVVGNVKQSAGSAVNGATTDELALTKIFIAKQIANTTVKMGRQELPKSLSPLAFSEGWNVYKNTFDAILAVNTDLPKTTLVGAYVTGGTSMTLGSTSDLIGGAQAGAAYMITAQTKLVPMSTITASYYSLNNIGAAAAGDEAYAIGTASDVAAGNTDALGGAIALGTIYQSTLATTAISGYDADALFLQAAIAPKDAPLGLKLDLQAGNIDPDLTGSKDTQAYGAKLSGKAGAVSFKAIYTTVDDGTIAMRNVGTNIKTPLFSQMMYNQNAIGLDSDTIVLGAAYNMGDMGTIAANYGMSDMGGGNGMMNANGIGGADIDYNELDLVYKVKSGGVQYFAIAAIRDIDAGGNMNTTVTGQAAGATEDTVLRFWARYNF